ncbi:MAG: hypothetical protein OMM_12370 [Candidatus Magnetoglobus multicellularis str. Araruama]|uniref:DUF3015 domain-containing protein n=1 Tax=Candidatus Magnetoglobus multicellularis str. Araruama TaxID=890399 RepID=A0A1V1NVX8_9BACT|nr:MAG: hypothetical protein OMM_12370 [Candidatus Magnetoglobus multicellularis str. Araruama]
MKKVCIAVLASLVLVSVTYAGSKENCGCGLGSMVLGEQDTLVMQLVISCLNGISGNQSFGITFGTLDCDKPRAIVLNEKLDRFVADNMDNLAVDMASGQGESLDALADLAEISQSKRPELYRALQANFDQIYPSAQTTHKEIVTQVVNIIEQI